jgi:hypothetical protein
MRIGGDGRAANITDVDARVKVVEEILKDYLPFFAGIGVGVLVWYFGVHFFSIALRTAEASAPELNMSIASRATSMQTAHP